ncbi:hypothetical protein [Mesorhizobium sp. M0674]|uniref:hypothetical protein n=1 Tax=unclassified Mesorhizobium TaxID=325217 RepID=UPI00333E047F
MTERPLYYYRPMELPSFCYLWEAVMWVTFGRFPEVGVDEDDHNGEVGKYSFAWKDAFGGPGYRFRGFWWFEAEMAGVDLTSVDLERYETALRTGYARPDLLEQDIAREKNDPHDHPRREEYFASLMKRRAEEMPFIDHVHSLFQQHIDIGWAQIFQALASGSLKGFGWGDLTQDEIREHAARVAFTDFDHATDEGNVYNPFLEKIPESDTIGPLVPMGLMMEIPRKEWSLSGIAPDARYVAANGRHYWDVVFPSDRVFELFPRPLLTWGALTKDTVETLNPGLTVSAEHDAGPHKALPPPSSHIPAVRGRRKLADGEIERACQSLYGRRLASGEKELALAEEAAAFAMEVWGERLSRSTFQSYMLPFKRAVPEIVPEIAAE